MSNRHDKILFWGCFIAILTTAYAFISRMILCGGHFATDFSLDKVTVGELQGAGVWPFGVSIILFSLIIDRIGYKTAMCFSFACYIVYCAMAFMAYGTIQGVTGDALVAAQHKGYGLLYWGSVILALGNGTVEAYANPVVATLFSKEKTKWLNMLHAGWPAGLVVGGLCTIALANQSDWRLVVGIILIPAVISFLMLVGVTFPKNEREQAGVGYVDMLKELGMFGALVGFGLVFAQLAKVAVDALSKETIEHIGATFHWTDAIPDIRWKFSVAIAIALTVPVVIIFGIVTKSFGRPLLAFLILIMMPLATTEIGTDGWISSLMEVPMKNVGGHPGWVLVYTSAIMMVLRFCAGPIVHKLSPLGLLATCATLAILGLTALSFTGNLAGSTALLGIFAAATLYACGKTFFWPTMLGITSEQCPKGGALTLNSMGGIGMLAVGILGFPFIGFLQESTATAALRASNPEVASAVTVEKSYLLGAYSAIDPVKAAKITSEDGKKALAAANVAGQFSALGKMAIFPGIMLCGYLILIVYFRSRGGYKAVHIHDPIADEEAATF
jgi:MFS family permease